MSQSRLMTVIKDGHCLLVNRFPEQRAQLEMYSGNAADVHSVCL